MDHHQENANLETGRKIDSFAKRFPVENGILDSERVDKAM